MSWCDPVGSEEANTRIEKQGMKETGARCNVVLRIRMSLVLDMGAAGKKTDHAGVGDATIVAARSSATTAAVPVRHSAVNLPEFGRIVN
jgi:hypothetical protein